MGAVIGAPEQPLYVGVNVAPEIRHAIDAYARHTGSSRAAVVRQIFGEWMRDHVIYLDADRVRFRD